VHSRCLAAMPRTHQDKTALLQLLFHHLYFEISGHKDLRVQAVLAHLLHHRLHQVVGRTLAFVLFVFLVVLKFNLWFGTPSR
jgi:hypothetical protein